jgi:hypothetical protein
MSTMNLRHRPRQDLLTLHYYHTQQIGSCVAQGDQWSQPWSQLTTFAEVIQRVLITVVAVQILYSAVLGNIRVIACAPAVTVR